MNHEVLELKMEEELKNTLLNSISLIPYFSFDCTIEESCCKIFRSTICNKPILL